jgi:hypothetical protein
MVRDKGNGEMKVVRRGNHAKTSMPMGSRLTKNNTMEVNNMPKPEWEIGKNANI